MDWFFISSMIARSNKQVGGKKLYRRNTNFVKKITDTSPPEPYYYIKESKLYNNNNNRYNYISS